MAPRHPAQQTCPNEGPTARGWQHKAANVIQTRYRAQLFTALDPASSQAMLTSQAGPHSSRAFTTIPFGPDFHCPSHLFRILFTSSSTPPTPVGSSNLPMPSRSRPSWRPSRSLCPSGGFAESGERRWNGQPPGYAGKRGPGSPLTHCSLT